jgi:DSF synthase
MEYVAQAPQWAGASRGTPAAHNPIRPRAGREGLRPGLPAGALGSFDELDVRFDEASRTCWCGMQPLGGPSFTPALLSQMAALQGQFTEMFMRAGGAEAPLRYVVVGSKMPGIFNLGGDLTLFKQLIRARDRQGLRAYARACIDVVYRNAVAYDLPIITIAMVQGDALGGGFEAALSCNIIVAERSAKFGLPEILFNLFPGMGAYSFLSRRIGMAAAEKMILSGKVYEAAELHAMGVVDILVEDGEAPAAIEAYIQRNGRRHNAEQAVFRMRQIVNPLNYEELTDIGDLWVDTALKLIETDLRKMERITLAQQRRWKSEGSLGGAA